MKSANWKGIYVNLRRKAGVIQSGDPGSLLLRQLQRGVVPASQAPAGPRDAGQALLAQLQRRQSGGTGSPGSTMPVLK